MSDLTPEEMAALLVAPGLLPGLDAFGLRVATWTGYHRNDLKPSGRELFLCVTRDGEPLVFDPVAQGQRLRDHVAFDLADASTRDRIARWVAGRVGLEVAATAPDWLPTLKYGLGSGGIGYRNDGGYWTVAARSHTRHFRAPVDTTLLHVFDEVPGLVGVDPHDDRRLSDGSHYVDALALARAAAHLGAK